MNTTATKMNEFRLPGLFVLGKMMVRTFKDWRLERIIVQAKKEHAAGKTMRWTDDFGPADHK